MKESLDGWDARIFRWMDERMFGWMQWKNLWTDGWENPWTDGMTESWDGWMRKYSDGWFKNVRSQEGKGVQTRGPDRSRPGVRRDGERARLAAIQPASQPARRDERERWRCSEDPTQPSFRCNNAVPAFQDDVETGDAHLAWFFFYPARAPLYESGDPLPWIQ
jgi:hypothetical protein